jgi:hypothetical protein
MKLTRTREFVINMGNYESFRTSATVEVEIESNVLTANDKANRMLDQSLADDLKSAAKLSNVKDTYVLTWNEEKY